MIKTHVVIWICGRATWVWKYLTFAQWAALPNVAKKLALIKAGKMTVAVGCVGGIGVALPPVINGLDRAPVVRTSDPVNIPEPWSMAVLAVGVGGVLVVRKR